MASRGKKRSSVAAAAAVPSHREASQLAQQDAAVSSPDRDYPAMAASKPRRSSRRTGTTNTAPDKGVASFPHLRNLKSLEMTGKSETEAAKVLDKQMQDAKDQVNDTTRTLRALEVAFRNENKRRKIQVEESAITNSEEEFVTASRPRMPRGESLTLQPPALLTPEGEKEPCAQNDNALDGIAEAERDADEDVVEPADRGAKRAPAVNSDYLPLPWKGRLGYACLNTYLRAAKPPVFSSRTCRIASILEHRHPLSDPSQPEHATKNRPDKSQAPSIARGERWVEALGLANARDTVKMLRWNEKYGIKFMRLSSEMFPFASHEEYGYKLAPFASEGLAEVGKVAAEFGHRLTTHPGQFTQLGSPRTEVVKNAVRDLEYHDELLSLLRLPPQQDRDAVMILHMGGMFADSGGKAATLDRFRKNYATLSPSIKRRLVLENDDVVWSVHDLLPICEELDIPLVLDYHHHNIIFDDAHYREGTFDISQPAISARIKATWDGKGITQKMHYSEPCAGAVTPRDRRKHSARVATLPPCPPDMDLMIEAKDKEQAVFALVRHFKLPGFERIADMVAHEREDQDRAAPPVKKPKKTSRKRKAEDNDEDAEKAVAEADTAEVEGNDAPGALKVSPEEFGMGGPQGRVYWPFGFEDWLSPKKKEKKVKIVAEGEDEN
ncbi:unnamed protein product [Discula destructiva]